MGRFLFVLSLAGLAWWGFSTWFAGPTGEGDAETAPEPRLREMHIRQVSETGIPVRVRAGEPGVGVAGAEQRLVEQVGEIGPPPAQVVEARPLDARSPQEGEGLGQVADAVAAADPERALQLLGSTNAFLHTPDGRSAGDKILELAAGVPDDRALGLLTGLLELCMRGAISPEDSAARDFVNRAYEALRKPVKRHLFDPTNLTRARSYRVQPGDALSRIARKLSQDHGLKLESGTLAMVNRITNPNAIRAGQVLKAPMDPVHTVVEKRSFLMAVYLGPTMIRLYWIGHGEDDMTPETEFTVEDKIEKPDWYHPDGGIIPYGHVDNVLGEYFVKFSHPSYTGFGAHGTNQEETVGTMQSMGCIRMYDRDVREYFQFVPRGSKVVVRAGG